MEIGITVPTMGTRPELLKQCLQSIREAGPAFVTIVAPCKSGVTNGLDQSFFDLLVPDPMLGLAAAINAGITALPKTVSFVNWLGDDDLLTPGSLNITLDILTNSPKVVLAYGGCEYIDENGTTLWRNKSGRFASPLLHFGPQLIPQPGALIRRDAYTVIGGLNTSYKWAFDLDLLLRLKKVGTLQFVDTTLAKFRWHEGSLSVGGRRGSVNEASSIRRASLPKVLRIVSPLWEIPMKQAILVAGNRLNRKLKQING